MSDKHQLIDLVLQINSSAANGLAITEIWRNSVYWWAVSINPKQITVYQMHRDN